MANQTNRQLEYWEILEKARSIQHTFSNNSLTKAVQYVLQQQKK